ncbi:isopentenyl-diphosphate Delta-isomerase [Nocardia tengchongensis]|uniref:isopentenyl-diphosphate Delta-isomerase n=1 Tax=Nocardia tengchongensis TaxID=2055889 RepID=UPI0036947AA7
MRGAEPLEQVVLLDEDGHRIGTADKATVHTRDTPLHLAFSCYVFDSDNRFLLSRRALSKPTWPGIWTNSCCGHPGPDEDLTDAVARRLDRELGLTATAIDLILPTFRYRAVMPDGTVEFEMCPVYRVRADPPAHPSPDEVDELRWLDWEFFLECSLAPNSGLSPWCLQQLDQLRALDHDVSRWPVADAAELPPAARAPHLSAP